MEETLIEMYLAGVSVRCMEDNYRGFLWQQGVSPSTISERNKEAYVAILKEVVQPTSAGRVLSIRLCGWDLSATKLGWRA